MLYTVLNRLDANVPVLDFGLVIRGYLEREQIDDVGIILLIQSVERLADGCADFGDIKGDDRSVPLCDLIHSSFPLF